MGVIDLVYYAVSNVGASGATMAFFARPLGGVSDPLTSTEVMCEVPVAISNAIWDWSIDNPLNESATNTGKGGFRSMSSDEYAAALSATAAASTNFKADGVYLATAYKQMKAMTPQTYPSTVAALCSVLVPFLMALTRIINNISVVYTGRNLNLAAEDSVQIINLSS